MENEGLVIPGMSIRSTPLYNAGLDIDDVIININNQPIKKNSDYTKLISRHKKGDRLEVIYLHRGEEKKTFVIVGENKMQKVVSYEIAGLPVTNMMKQFRKNWLEGK